MAVLTRARNVIRAGLTNLSTELTCVDVQCCPVGETSALMVLQRTTKSCFWGDRHAHLG